MAAQAAHTCAPVAMPVPRPQRGPPSLPIMQSLLARVVALSLIAGGFMLTGDIPRLIERGRHVIEGRSTRAGPAVKAAGEQPAELAEPAETAAAAAPAAPAPVAPAVGAAEPPAVAEAPASPTRPRDAAGDPVGRRVALPSPPADGPAAVEPRALAVGDRVLVWLKPEGRANRGGDLIALDIIEPGSAEALFHRHAALAYADKGGVQAAPRRVVIGAGSAARISRGERLRIAPVRGVNGPGGPEDLGTVAAIDVVRGSD